MRALPASIPKSQAPLALHFTDIPRAASTCPVMELLLWTWEPDRRLLILASKRSNKRRPKSIPIGSLFSHRHYDLPLIASKSSSRPCTLHRPHVRKIAESPPIYRFDGRNAGRWSSEGNSSRQPSQGKLRNPDCVCSEHKRHWR